MHRLCTGLGCQARCRGRRIWTPTPAPYRRSSVRYACHIAREASSDAMLQSGREILSQALKGIDQVDMRAYCKELAAAGMVHAYPGRGLPVNPCGI